MLDASSPPSWLRPVSLRWVDLSGEYFGAAARRTGGCLRSCPRTPEARQAWSDVIHSRRTLEGLKEVGVTAVCLHYDDGFGRAAQADDIRRASAFASVCRDLDLRVFARLEGGALYYEALLTDRPGLAAWAQRDPHGEIVLADRGVPAWRPCYRSRGFLEMLKETVSVACEQLEADGVLLANFGPHECHCERCQHTFRRLVTARHPDPRASLGLPSLEHVRLPVEASGADPLHYEAAHFRVYVLRSALGDLRIHLRSIGAQLALWAEPRLGAEAGSCAAFWDVCAPLDVVTWHELLDDGREEWEVTADEAHVYLCGHAARTSVCVRPEAAARSPGTALPLATSLGAAMAFGGHVLANDAALRCGDPAVRAPWEAVTPCFVTDEEMRNAWAQLLDLAGRHEHYHHRAESLAEVVLAFSAADVAAEAGDVAARTALERALLGGHLPFAVLPIEAVDATRHRVIVVAGQTRVTDTEADTIGRLACDGCGIVLMGEAGACDEHGRRRSVSAFAPLLTLPKVCCLDSLGERRGADWRAGILGVVRDLLPRPPVVELVAGDESGVLLCPFRLPTGQSAFHLLNTARHPVQGLRLHVRADLAPSRHVALHCPEASDTLLDSTLDAGVIISALPPLRSYALVVTS